jgi:hypothetical protein
MKVAFACIVVLFAQLCSTKEVTLVATSNTLRQANQDNFVQLAQSDVINTNRERSERPFRKVLSSESMKFSSGFTVGAAFGIALASLCGFSVFAFACVLLLSPLYVPCIFFLRPRDEPPIQEASQVSDARSEPHDQPIYVAQQFDSPYNVSNTAVHVNSFLTKDVNEGVYAIPNENFSK